MPSTPEPLAKFDTIYPPPPEPTTEFDRRYPSDRFGEEVKDDARVWKIYRDEASSEDRSMLDGWNKTLDVLLIFAGLFSAVSTAFIIESYKLLQPDYTQYLAEAFFATLSSSNGSKPFDLTSVKLSLPSATSPDPSSRWVNGLWFVSLGLSLSVALLCILAKQWLDEYHACTTAPASSPRHWTRRHVQYKEGLVRWHVPAFISVLPAVLHASLFLFLAGLYVFLGTLDGVIAAALLAIAAPLLVFYLSSIGIPMFAKHCPWSTALVAQILRLSHFMHREGVSLLYLVRERFEYLLSRPGLQRIGYKGRQRTTPTRSVHHVVPLAAATDLSTIEGKALEWLIASSPSSDIVLVAAGAIGSLHPLGDTISYLRASKASVIAARIARNLHRMEWGPRFGAITHARMRRLGLMLLDVAYDYRWSFAELHSPDQHHYDLPVLAGLRPTGSYPPMHHGPRAFDLMPYEEMSSAYVRQIEAFMKRTSCSSIQSDAPQPFLPSTVMLLLLHIPSVPLLVHAYHIYRMVWREDVMSIKFVAQCLRRSLIAHNIQPSSCGGCDGCVLARLELWCQVLDYAETWALDDDDRTVLEEDIRWLARSKQWNADECPFGVPHSLHHLPHALDVCASGKHSRPDVSISVLRTGMHVVQGSGPRPDGGRGLWNPAAARCLVNVMVSLRQCSMGVLPAELGIDLEFLLEDNPIGNLFDGICRAGYIPGPGSEGDMHPPYLWNGICPVPRNWAYSPDWDDPTCFLRLWDGQPTPWRLLHDLRAVKLDLLLVGDVLAAQLCAQRRSGREDPNLVAEFFIFDSCLPYLRRICLRACMADPEEDPGRIPFFPPLLDARDHRAMLLRFMQHCTELRGPDWWANGLSAFCATTPEVLVGEMENDQHENLKPRHEVVRIVRECRDLFVELDRDLWLRGRCRDCPQSENDGLRASAGRGLARWKPLRR